MDHFFEEEFKEKVLDSKVPVVMDFYADWCGPCRALSPLIDKITKEYGEDISVIKIDCDECEKLTTEMSIKTIPTIVIMKNGEEIARNTGYLSEKDLKLFIGKNIK